MTSGITPFAYTSPIAPGVGNGGVLPEQSVTAGLDEPLNGVPTPGAPANGLPGSGGFGDLPGNGSYGDPITGFHQINQQAMASQQAFSAGSGAASNAANATFESQNAARSDKMATQFAVNQANASARSQALFAGPTITGPTVLPNFAQTAKTPTPSLIQPDGRNATTLATDPSSAREPTWLARGWNSIADAA